MERPSQESAGGRGAGGTKVPSLAFSWLSVTSGGGFREGQRGFPGAPPWEGRGSFGYLDGAKAAAPQGLQPHLFPPPEVIRQHGCFTSGARPSSPGNRSRSHRGKEGAWRNTGCGSIRAPLPLPVRREERRKEGVAIGGRAYAREEALLRRCTEHVEEQGRLWTRVNRLLGL